MRSKNLPTVKQKKPRVRFCWNCGAKLYGNHHRVIKVDGLERIVHKTCLIPDRELIDPEDE